MIPAPFLGRRFVFYLAELVSREGRHAMRKQSIMSAILLAWIAPAPSILAAAEQQVARVGDMTIRTDAARWSATSHSPDELLLSPTSSIAGKHDAVRIVRRKGEALQDCRALAKSQWSSDIYADQRTEVAQLGGQQAVRITLHTRCRNATPTGVMVCTIHHGSLYAVMSGNAITDCRKFERVVLPQAIYFEELVRATKLRR